MPHKIKQTLTDQYEQNSYNNYADYGTFRM